MKPADLLSLSHVTKIQKWERQRRITADSFSFSHLHRFDLKFPVRLCLRNPVTPSQSVRPADSVTPAKSGIVSTQRSAPRNSHFHGRDEVNENENKKIILKKQEFSNQTGITETARRLLKIFGKFSPVFSSALALVFLSPAQSQELSFVNLARQIEPSVVNISITKTSSPNYFFPAPGIRIPSPPISGSGSGFVIDSKGLIVTNAHVIQGTNEIKVQFAGNKKFYKADLVGKDDLSDIALIRVKANRPLKPVKLGNSETIQVGERVAAFGNPHGYGHSMTQGIISAVKREIDDLNLFPLLQTDASINPGNSGGPLVNLKGEVVGVNNAIAAGAQGISFAIPIDNVKHILNDLKKYGYVQRAFIGVQLGHSPGVRGSLVMNVASGGPADRAKVQPYDLIVKFGKAVIKNSKDLANAVAKTPIDTRVPVQIIRNGQTKKLTITVRRIREDSFNFQKNLLGKNTKGIKTPLGFHIANPAPSVFKKLNLPDMEAGHPIVLSVTMDSPAGRAGLKTGDLIFKVNGVAVSEAKEVNKRLKRQNNTLHILRHQRLSGQYLAFVIRI